MLVRKQGRILVLMLMVAIFLYMLGKSISKWSEKKVGETQTSKSASQMVYPSASAIKGMHFCKDLEKSARICTLLQVLLWSHHPEYPK